MRKPHYVAECPTCRRDVGVVQDFQGNPTAHHTKRWRISVHGKPRCPMSRIEVPEAVVQRMVYTTSV